MDTEKQLLKPRSLQLIDKINFKLLDCTLRDGGYYTEWDFDSSIVEKYSQLISKLPVEYIEIGYRGLDYKNYYGEFYYTPKITLEIFKKNLRASQKISLMLNAKECSGVDVANEFLPYRDYVDMVRIATDPEKIEESLSLAKTLKALGFKIAINLMYISKLDRSHSVFSKLKNIEEHVDYLYLVDSYGSVYPNDLEKIIGQFREKCMVSLGFHGHNNLELAFINTLKAIECGVDIVDSTILGMGRGAGNLKLELLLTHLKAKEVAEVDLDTLSHLMELFMPLRDQYKWETNLPYMVSGSFSLPQKDVMEAIEINRYSIASIVNTMDHKSGHKLPIFRFDNQENKCLIVGGGSSVKAHIKVIITYLEVNKDMVIIHSTSRFLEEFVNLNNKQFFCVSGDELLKLREGSEYGYIDGYIFEPSPRKINVNIPENKSFCELENITFIDRYHDSPLALSLQVATEIGAENIELVGFDGYVELKSKKELYLMRENQAIISAFSKDVHPLTTLTKSAYEDLVSESIYAR